MKKIMMFVAVAAAAALAFSCNKETEPVVESVDANTNQNIGTVTPGDGQFSLTLSSPQTKTSFGDKVGSAYAKNWTVGDKINVNGIESKELTVDDGAGTSTATFHFESDISGAAYNVVYPASAYSASGVTIPAVQSTADGSFDPAADIILGYGTDPSAITLYNAVAYLKIKMKKGDYGNFGVKSIAVTSANKKLNGTFPVAGGTAITVPASSSDVAEETVTLNITGDVVLGDTEKEFLIALAPQTLAGGISVTVTDKQDNTQTMTKSSSTELPVGAILAQPAFKFQEYVPIKTADDLMAFAADCSAGTTNYYVIEANIDMTGKTWPAAGTADSAGKAFNGTLDGGNKGDDTGFKISHLTSTTGAFIKYALSSAMIKNVTLDETCSIGLSSNIDANCYIGGIVGVTRGSVANCYNYAPVSCTSTSFSGEIWVGGIAGRLYRTGSISGCYNKAAINCSPTGATVDNKNVYIGGIVGSVERPKNASDNAVISNCENSGNITADPDVKAFIHVGGVVGWICSVNGTSSKMTVSGLVNTGNVVRSNAAQSNDHPVLVAGLIGGIHGTAISNMSGEVEVKNSHVRNCTVQNGGYNNSNGYGQCSHTGGLLGLARGLDDGSGVNIIFSEGCSVNNVEVICRRGYAGGFASWLKGTRVDGCNVLGSSIKGSLAQCWHAGGIAGHMRNSEVKNCTITLTKDAQYSLYTSSKDCNSGGVVGHLQETCVIENCRAFVQLMYQNTAGKEGYRGWIVGNAASGSLVIKNCGLGGTYGKSTATIVLDSSNFSSYIYGSASAIVPTLEGTQYYWDGTI